MFVRLKDSSKGPAGKWIDAATGEHGDLLDVIREVLGLADFADVAEEARRFLCLPHPQPAPLMKLPATVPTRPRSTDSARRLFAMAMPIGGTLVETYLGHRGITLLPGTDALRFHPRCYYRPSEHEPTESWPAMIAAVIAPAAQPRQGESAPIASVVLPRAKQQKGRLRGHCATH